MTRASLRFACSCVVCGENASVSLPAMSPEAQVRVGIYCPWCRRAGIIAWEVEE